MVALALAFVANRATAKTIYFGSAPELVPVASGDTTVLHFEEPVKRISNAASFIIKPLNEEVPDYTTLGVTPRSQSGKSEVAFVLASGEIARLRLSVVPRQAGVKVDFEYEVKSRKALVESRAEALPAVGRLELMTAMIRGDQVAGYEVSNVARTLSSQGASIRVVLDRVYEGSDFKGYVYEVQNLSPRQLDLDVRKLQFGNPSQAVLAYSDLDLLDAASSGKDKTRVIVVAKPTSTYRDAVLPVRVTQQKAGEKSGGGDE
jgi:hypothetical protein